MFYRLHPAEVAEPRGLSDLFDITETVVDWEDLWAYDALADFMGAAPSFLDEVLAAVFEQVKGGLEGRIELPSSNSFTLKRWSTHYIRVNFWRRSRSEGSYRPDEVRLYAYGLPHDHDFDLLTVGLAGTGYTTKIYRYDGPSGRDRLPFNVESTFLGDFRVGVGDVLFMECNRDIHIQFRRSKLLLP